MLRRRFLLTKMWSQWNQPTKQLLIPVCNWSMLSQNSSSNSLFGICYSFCSSRGPHSVKVLNCRYCHSNITGQISSSTYSKSFQTEVYTCNTVEGFLTAEGFLQIWVPPQELAVSSAKSVSMCRSIVDHFLSCIVGHRLQVAIVIHWESIWEHLNYKAMLHNILTL